MKSLSHIAKIGCHLLVIKSEQVLVVLLGLTHLFRLHLKPKCCIFAQIIALCKYSMSILTNAWKAFLIPMLCDFNFYLCLEGTPSADGRLYGLRRSYACRLLGQYAVHEVYIEKAPI